MKMVDVLTGELLLWCVLHLLFEYLRTDDERFRRVGTGSSTSCSAPSSRTLATSSACFDLMYYHSRLVRNYHPLPTHDAFFIKRKTISLFLSRLLLLPPPHSPHTHSMCLPPSYISLSHTPFIKHMYSLLLLLKWTLLLLFVHAE
ncbi:hypothetical protein C8Q72DRAFT_271710 [Fomitopsis betulina]|nr:hypothetical protein C8Q72DRAFT_271710 [Fomitopsis betulina]